MRFRGSSNCVGVCYCSVHTYDDSHCMIIVMLVVDQSSQWCRVFGDGGCPMVPPTMTLAGTYHTAMQWYSVRRLESRWPCAANMCLAWLFAAAMDCYRRSRPLSMMYTDTVNKLNCIDANDGWSNGLNGWWSRACYAISAIWSLRWAHYSYHKHLRLVGDHESPTQICPDPFAWVRVCSWPLSVWWPVVCCRR